MARYRHIDGERRAFSLVQSEEEAQEQQMLSAELCPRHTHEKKEALAMINPRWKKFLAI
ncbi:MAG: hypothetical protein HC828_11965 [Blastochloris sp.]|nr:hypothetical protein [Blastochloris sp.]